MKNSVSPATTLRRPLGRAVAFACLCALLCGATAGALAADAADAPSAPLLNKPLPASGTDTVTDQPSPQHVYISGHWTWKDGAYAWASGHWELPPTNGAVWVASRWEKKDAGYALVEGYWQEGAQENDAEPAADSERSETSVVVEDAPPPPEREIIVERPSPAHIWIGGYWGWRAGRHVWVSGRWDLPPRTNVVWVPSRWERRGHGYVLVEGCWRDSVVRPRTTVVIEDDGWRSDGVITIAPPPLRREYHRPPRPGFDFVWIDGYWAWHGGRHVWIGGRWDRPPHGHRHWRQPRWEHHHGGYIFVEGRWD